MFFVATAFYYMNRADQDCGTTFSWVTRAMGPYLGWIGGWAICVTGILVVGSLADVAARYTYLFFGLDGLAGSKVAITLFAVIIIVAMTALCVIGTEISARVQDVMIIAQVGALLLFAVVALVRVYGGTAPEGSLVPELSWFSPFAVDSTSALIAGLLIGVFIYWGWESSVNLTEETENSETRPGPRGRRQHGDPARHLPLGRGRGGRRSAASERRRSSPTTTPSSAPWRPASSARRGTSWSCWPS